MSTSNPGNRPLSLATHLRSLSDLLFAGSLEYSWIHQESCNCGILARSIMGITPRALKDMLMPDLKALPAGNKTWQLLADSHCPITGEPTHKVFKQLAEAGLQLMDFNELENLSNPAVRKRMLAAGYTITEQKKRFMRSPLKVERKIEAADIIRHNGTHAAGYMQAWASLIEEFHAENASPTEAQMEAIEARPLVEGK